MVSGYKKIIKFIIVIVFLLIFLYISYYLINVKNEKYKQKDILDLICSYDSISENEMKELSYNIDKDISIFYNNINKEIKLKKSIDLIIIKNKVITTKRICNK